MPKSSKLKNLQREIAKLRNLVYRDELTGLLNRRGFREIAEKIFKEIQWGRRHRDKRKSFPVEAFSVLFLDLDHFKWINDHYGHDAGDKALCHIAKLVLGRLRGIDVIGRWGGEEIVVGLVGADRSAAAVIAEDIRQIVERSPIVFQRKRIPLSVSIGVAGLKRERKLSELINRADKAMYQAKKSGRNAVFVTR